jgi:uncharacterized protein involved in exopolysaccharide biosynthesis
MPPAFPSPSSPPGPSLENAPLSPARAGTLSYGDALDLSDFVSHWRLIVSAALVVAVLALVLGLRKPRTYTSRASFIPQQRELQGNLGSLAAQFGVAVQSGPPGQSPQFYADLVKTRDLLVSVLDSPYVDRLGNSPRAVRLADALKARGATPALRQDDALRKLRVMIDASVTAKTGVVSLSVRMPTSALAQQVAARVLALVNKFNLEIRQTQAAAERRFAEQRQRDAQTELRQAEDRLQQFLAQNRSYAGSSQLQFEHDRLDADVQLRRQTYSSLTQAYEQARIDEVRDTPVITVIESPDFPARPDARGLASRVELGLIAGAMLGGLAAWLRRRLAASRRQVRMSTSP